MRSCSKWRSSRNGADNSRCRYQQRACIRHPAICSSDNTEIRSLLMKVVLFCGGLGMRLKDTEESLPKPLVKIGNMPILWHVMKYYAYYGHKDFILCLGYKADLIKQHFLNYNECLLNDFVLTDGGRSVELLSSDMRDWKITFVDTGMYCTVGQRLKLVQRYLEGEEMFLTNYSDGLTNLPLPNLIDFAKQQNTIATF